MAKSLRSKWKRKMKAIKRIRYGEKELEKLKMIVGGKKGKLEPDLTALQDIVTVVPPASEISNTEDTEMCVDNEKAKVYDPSTLKDQYGNYPVWMSSHRKKRKLKAEKKMNKNKRKQARKGNRKFKK